MLAEATPLALSRLLALYPVNFLKDKWPQHRKKEEILAWAVQNVERREIKEFLDEYFDVCKQHVYIFSHRNSINNLPRFRIQDAEKLGEVDTDGGKRVLYLAEVEFHVVLLIL